MKDFIHEVGTFRRDLELYTNRHCFYGILAWFLA